jgi:sugar-specific transcriptional regulator TrmB
VAERGHLTELGFNALEAEAYCALLEGGPATAYRVAQRLGKQVANLYQALAGLAQRGAVEVDEDGPRVYRAAEPDILLGRLDRDFQVQRAAAAAGLAGLRRAQPDERLYQIRDYSQAMERARHLIANAREILVFDLFPDVVEELADVLNAASGRGVLVAGMIYAEAHRLRALTARSALPEALLARWPGRQLSVVADAARHITALLAAEEDAVVRAFASDSPYLACMQHSGLCAEIRLTALLREGVDRLEPVSLLGAYPEGLRTLLGTERPLQPEEVRGGE